MTKEKLGEYLKPIAVRMFGKQGAGPRYQRPQFTIRPLAAMLEDLAQISDASALNEIVDEILKKNQKSIEDFRAGKTNALGFLVG
ncbi:MAG: Asp-tRNA(Asn)/Glu-tRNA(Gln) amidotransferase GatCAB subunit B, partial [Ruthenibacterium sp.]